ncbi:hypothetical protein BGZ98_010112 [Dissophora globulifera]|nr:hypothetical protein BGZ98_010112 [Dissophora globulifera]
MTATDRSVSKRFLHSTRSRGSFFSQDTRDKPSISFAEQGAALSELRQKAFIRASPKHIWAAYRRMVKAQALPLMQSDDVVVLFQALLRSDQTEESMEMMLQVALDVNDMGKQLPQEAFDIMMRQAVDQLPAEQTKAALWQIQGRRRFITEFIQLCDSNAEMKRFLGLYNQLIKASFDVDGFSTYYQSRKERAGSLADIVLQWIKSEGRAVNPKVVENLLVYLLDRNIIDGVYTTIVRRSKEGFSFSHGFFTTAIHRFGLAQKFDYMEITLDHMRRQGLEPLEDTYSAMIDAHSKAGNLREAQRAYQDILAAELVPTEVTFGPMLEAVGKMGDYDMTRQLVDQMNASGIPSNEYTFSALLQSLSHDPEKSTQLFEELSKQVLPNTVNYNLLIRTFQRHGDLDGAFRVFRVMIADHIKPDQYTFSSILSLFASRGDAEGAGVFWNEMVKVHRVVPNAHAYGSMMHVYCTTEDMLSAQTVYREMIQAGIMPNEVIFGTLLNAYARRGDLTQMLSIYDAMRAEGLKPNSYIYANLLFGLVKDGDMSAAQRLYENMEEDGYGRNVLAQTILMKGYLDQNRFKESQGIYRNMIRSGLVPNYMTYASLMQAYTRRGNTQEGRAFLDKIMKSRGLVYLGEEDEEGEMAADDAVASDDYDDGDSGNNKDKKRQNRTSDDPSPQESSPQEGHLSSTGTERKPLKTVAKPKPLLVFTPLLDAYAKESNLFAAKAVFEEIKARGLKPNTITYTMLMDGYRRAGDVESVLGIWGELFERFQQQLGEIQDHPERYRPLSKGPVVEWVDDRLSIKGSKLQRLMQRPVSITLDALCYSGRIEEAKALWQQLEKLGFDFDSANWNDYCIALMRNGLLMEACRILQDKLLPGFESELQLSSAQSRLTQTPASAPRSDRRSQGWHSRVKDMDGSGSPTSFMRADIDSNEDNRASGPSWQPRTLLYPRPRTFAALADALEDLLSLKSDRRGRYQDVASTAVFTEPEERALKSSSLSADTKLLETKRLERRRKLIEARLQPYPRPFEKLDENHRQILWSMIRTEYRQVLEALDEGMLVAAGPYSNRSGTAASPAPVMDEFERKFNKSATTTTATPADSRVSGTVKQQEEEDEQQTQEQQRKQGGFTPFRQWRRLKSVMRDMERKQFLEDRKSFSKERDDRRRLV